MGAFDEFLEAAKKPSVAAKVPTTLEGAAEAIEPEPGGVQKFLNIIDYPAATIRHALVGKEMPDVTTGEDRVTGREILTKLFGAPKNKQTGWGVTHYYEEPEELLLDTLGFATEVALDPLTYVGFGGLSRAGREAKTLGTLPKGFFKQMATVAPDGSRYRNVLSVANPAKGIFSPADTPVIEGLSPEVADAAQGVADNIAKAFLKAPGVQSTANYANSLYRRAKGVGSPAIRKVFREGRFDQIRRGDEGSRAIYDLEHKLNAAFKGQDADEAMKNLRVATETPAMMQGQIDPAINNLRQDFIDFYSHMADDLKDAGVIDHRWLDITPLFDPQTVKSLAASGRLTEDTINELAGYVARGSSNVAGDVRIGRAVVASEGGARQSFEYARSEALGRGWIRGAEGINEFATDPDLIAALDDKALFGQIAEKKYGGQVSKYIQARDDKGKMVFRDLKTGKKVGLYDSEVMDAIAKMAKDKPKELADGLYEGVRPKFASGNSGRVSLSAVDPRAFAKAARSNPDLSKDIARSVSDLGDESLDILMGRKSYFDKGVEYRVNQVAGDEAAQLVRRVVDGEEQLLSPVVHGGTDRFQQMRSIMRNPKNEKVLTEGVFPNDLMTEMHGYAQAHAHRVGMVNSAYRAIGNAIRQGGDMTGASQLDNLIQSVFQGSVNRAQARKKIYSAMMEEAGTPLTRAELDKLTREEMDDLLPWDTLVNADLAQDLHNGTIHAASNPRGVITQAMADYGTLWKASVLTWPSRYVRDYVSASMRLMEGGLVANPVDLAPLAHRAHKIFLGHGDQRLLQVPAVRDQLKHAGINPDTASPEDATLAFKYLFAKERGGAMTIRQDLAQGEVIGMRGVQRAVPGTQDPSKFWSEYVPDVVRGDADRRAANIADRFGGSRLQTAMRSPSDLMAVEGKGKISNAIAEGMGRAFRFGDAVGDYTDTTTRMMGFLSQLEQGVDSKTAMGMVQSALINYDPRKLDPFEQKYLKAWVPFYTFWRHNLPWVANQLMHRPGGPVRQLLRLTQSPESEADPTLPDWMRETVAVPLHSEGSDTKMFLTSFGLMTEDALGVLGGGAELFTNPGQGARSLFLELSSKAHPIPRGLVEWGTGTSTFMTGPEGGRRLSEMDPPIGRLLSNVGLADDPGVLPGFVEHMAPSLPFMSRLITAGKTITDTRDVPTAHRILNLISGMKVSTQSPQQQLNNLQDRIDRYKMQYGPATYNLQRTVVNKAAMEKLPPEQQAELMRLDSVSKAIPKLKKLARDKKDQAALEERQKDVLSQMLGR